MRPILWLASYPKSGNTWLRVLLANLGRSEPVDINALKGEGGIASARGRFDNAFLIASGLLTHDECDSLRPQLYRSLGDDGDNEHWHLPDLHQLRWLKTHDAWTCTSLGEPVLGGRQAATGAVLILRDPRDIVASLAHHNGQSLDQAIEFMNRADAAYANATNRQTQQLRQRLLNWSGFYQSWLDQTELPLLVLRYEDMLADTAAALGAVLQFAGISVDPGVVATAAQLSSFEVMRAQEQANGFREAPRALEGRRFFRQGRSGGWREELDEAQRSQIEQDHGALMRRFGYLPAGDEAPA